MRQTRLIITISLTIILFLFTRHILHLFPTPSTLPSPVSLSLQPVNSTLNFGTILAVSPVHSPRRPSLLWAANLTDLSIVIPELKAWSDDDLTNFRAERGSSISNGSAKAWLGHLEVLRWFLNTSLETALILEDDTDFSTHIRQQQIPLFAQALHSILSSPSDSSSPTSYYPHPSTWSILYPGHCDDLPFPHRYLSHPHAYYADPSTPSQNILHPATSHFLGTLHVPDSTRLVHRAIWPFCTFAYAVHRESARRIVRDFSREKEGGISAFDVQLLEACRDGHADGWKCWSVVPELFHHVIGVSQIGRVDDGSEDGNDSDAQVERSGGQGQATWNFGGCSARHPELWVDEDDVEGRDAVKNLVREMIQNGECVGSDAIEKTWRGCEWDECGGQS